MAEPLACCLHGIDRISLKEGQSVAVVGCGAIGLIMVQLALLGGASRVYASDPVEKRRQLAESFGAIPLDPGHEEPAERIRKDLPEGVDAAVECAGNPAAMMQAIRTVRRGGTAMLFSVPEVDAVLQLPPYEVFFRELTILGSFTNPSTQGRAVSLIRSGRIQLEPLISHRLPLDSIEEAFGLFGKPEALKIVVEPS
jgi:threonine dehydrogenase-like Zn-dependent dehydrogenase